MKKGPPSTAKKLLESAQGLIFDLDGTLTLTQHFHARAFGQIFKKYGIKYTPKDDLRYAGRGSHCIFPEFFAEHGKTITEKQVEKLAEQKKKLYNRLLSTSTVRPVPGIKKFLKKMKAEGKRLIVASGNRLESIEIIFKKTGLREFFEDIITNKDVQKSKPAPDIFLKAAEKLGLKPGECVVFEDSLNGIQAAKAGKIPCIGVATGIAEKELKKEGAKFVIDHYSKIS